jgi:hypothetical protein
VETLDTDALRAALRVIQREPGVMTNYYFELLEASSFPVLRSEHSLVFLDLRATGWQVFYATREPADLTRLLQHLSREPLICDVRVRIGESAYGAEIPAAFQAAAFEQIARYIRMTTPSIAMHPSTRAVVPATRADADAVADLLQLAFDPRGEHLPSREELVRWLDLGQVLVHRTGHMVDGLCVWQIDGHTCHWRFWTTRPGTHPAIAVGLLGDMVAELGRRGVSKTVLWVDADKAGPRATYRRLGFRDDGVETHVYTRRSV